MTYEVIHEQKDRYKNGEALILVRKMDRTQRPTLSVALGDWFMAAFLLESMDLQAGTAKQRSFCIVCNLQEESGGSLEACSFQHSACQSLRLFP